jgi:lipopolysaccharide/colanic/teichoic acid biosynthesis glycosyltransferase
VPSRDIPAASATLDLSEERSFLALNEQWLLKNGHSAGGAALTQLAPGIWIGPGCRIDPTSRIYGPAILHDGVTVETGAAVIGPAVLGQGAHVERGALVSHSVVGARARVVQRTHLVNRVLAPGLRSDAVAGTGTAFVCENGACTCSCGRRARSAHEGVVRSSDPAVVRSLTSHYRSDPSWPPWDWALPALAGLSGNGRAGRGGAAGRSSASHHIYAFVKRAFDLVTALCGLLVLSPLLLLVAALVKLTSPGPVLFGDEREGRGGRVFRCWKFRTMVEGAHAQQRALYQQSVVDGPQFKILADPRTTTLGRFLRAINIDELPQLFNVVRGDMSLIGPRPSPFRENQICVPWREARLSVRPGITGLWQVCRNERPTGDFHQWIYFDTLYVRHRAFWLDLRILAATFLTLGGRWGVPLEWMIPARRLRRWKTAVPLAADRAAAPRAASLASGVQLWCEVQLRTTGAPERAEKGRRR